MREVRKYTTERMKRNRERIYGKEEIKEDGKERKREKMSEFSSTA
jgi:hypothetical protein